MHISSPNCAKTMSPTTNNSGDAEGGGRLGQRPLFAAAATVSATARQRWRKSGGSIAALAAETMTITKIKATEALVAAVAAWHQRKRGGGGGVIRFVAVPVCGSGGGSTVTVAMAAARQWWWQRGGSGKRGSWAAAAGSAAVATAIARRWHLAVAAR